MSEQFVNSLATLEAVSILDRVLIDEGAGAILIDELTGTGLLDVTQRFWAFRHELLGQFFAAIELQRRFDESGLAAELSRPRNRDLAEFVISLASEPSLILECFRALKDPGLISIATSGDLGRPAKEAAQSQILAMFHTILDDLNTLRMELKFPDSESGEVWPLLRITNGGQWSDYQMAILRAIGISLAKGMYISEFVALIERLETLPHQVFTDESNVGKAAKAPLQELLFQAFYRDQFMQPQAHFATATIIASARETAWRYEHLRAPQAIILLLEAVCEQRTGTLFLLANLLRQYRQDERVHASLPLLFNACWDSGLYHLRLDAIYMVQGFSHSLSVQHREIIKEKLPSLLSDNFFLNTVVAEAMSAYGILEPIADVDSVGKILKEILSRPDDPEARQAAHGAISNIFEDVLDGVYSEAIHELSREDQIRLYTMAAYGTPNYSWFGDFILQELLDFNDPNTLPVFEHWAASIDTDSSSIQTVVRSYQLAVMGCARFSTAPPQLAITDSNDWLAWQQYGEIIFWMNKAGCDEAELRTRCQRAWELLTTDLISEAVDPLMQFEHSDRGVSLNGGLARRLFLLFPEPIRVILEHGLVHLDKLSTIFAKVEPFNKDRRPGFVISSLGWVGNIETVKLLEPLVDSPTLGRSAVQSIRQIKTVDSDRAVSSLSP